MKTSILLVVVALAFVVNDRSVSAVVEQLELSGPGVQSAAIAMGSIRAAIGFLVFHLGFVMKRAGEPSWVFGILAIAMSLGGMPGDVQMRMRPRHPRLSCNAR